MAKIKIAVLQGLSAIKKWIKVHQSEAFLLLSVLLIGSFLRLYKISEYMTFLGDEGRDAIIVRNLLVHFDPILVGPGTSIGNMYLGPLYYYLIAPFLLLFNFSPVGPSVMVALFGVATIFLVWFFVRDVFPDGKNKFNYAAVLSAFLYAISPVVIIYNRSSWNPNIMPFFSLLCVFSVWKAYKDLKFRWLIILGLSYAFVLQSHYLGLLLAPTLGIYLLLTYLKARNYSNDLKVFWKNSIIGLLIFIFLMSPLVIFDARHDWRNLSALTTFFTNRQETVSAKPWSSIPKLWPLFERINTRLLASTNAFGGKVVSLFIVFGGAILLIKLFRLSYVKTIFTTKKQFAKLINFESPYVVILLWLLVAFVGLGNYKQEIYDHYYGFFFVAPFILLGMIIVDLAKKINISIIFTLVIVCYLTFLSINESPIKYPPNNQLGRSEKVATKIIEEAKDKPYNFSVIAERNYEGAYQYFLEKENSKLYLIDPQIPSTITDQLYVVCELPEVKCEPTTNSKAGIANFGWSIVDQVWHVEGVTVYRLVHNKI